MTPQDKYNYIIQQILPTIPPGITGRRRKNTKNNIRLYVQRILGIKDLSNVQVIVHRNVIQKVDELLEKIG